MTALLRRSLAALAAAATLTAAPAYAQFGTKPAPSAAPASPGATASAASTSANDFDAVIGRFGFGWTGISTLPIAATDGSRASIDVPVIGLRYWSPSALGPFQNFGIDVGVGLGAQSGKQGDVKTPSGFGLLLHGGLPLVLSHRKHVALELTPELNIGFASGSAEVAAAGGTTSIDLSGFRLDVGARAGAEVFFGFMGLPQLSLEASVGLFLRMSNWSASAGGNSVKGNATTFGTERFNAPWDIFTGTVAARYYF